jgi:HSP20 family protein
MSLMRYNNDWRGFRSDVDRLFDEFFGRGNSGTGLAKAGANQSVWAPAVDVSEDADNFVVHAELPGLKPADIDIELESNVLTLKGQRSFERKGEQQNYHFVERSYGSFYRSFTLPRNVDPNGIQASFEDGVLTISIPKAEAAKPRKVQIGSGEQPKARQIEAKGKTMAAGASD